MQMSVLDWNGLVYYDKKIKKHIKDKISEAVSTGEGGTVDLSAYATKEELKNHTDNANLHVTLAEKNTWNAKLDNSDLEDYATKTYVTDEIAKASTGGTIDLTGYAKTTDVNSALNTKVDKVDGKGLSTNDYTNDEVAKVGKIQIDGSEKEFLTAKGTYIGLYTKDEINDLLYPLLNPYKAPTVVLSSDKTIFEIGTINTIKFTATITKGRDNIKKVTFKKGTDIVSTINDPTSMTQEFSDTLDKTTTVSVTVNDGTNDISKSVTVDFVKKSFYGIVDAMVTNSTITGSQIKALNNFLSTTKAYDYNSINISNKKIIYVYDKSKGKLSSILDGNGFDMLSSYTMSELTIDGTDYYVYILTNPTTVTNYKQSFK